MGTTAAKTTITNKKNPTKAPKPKSAEEQTLIEQASRQRTIEQCVLTALVEELTGKYQSRAQEKHKDKFKDSKVALATIRANMKTGNAQGGTAHIAAKKAAGKHSSRIKAAEANIKAIKTTTSSRKRHHLSLHPSVSMPELIGKYFVGPEIEPLYDIKPHELSSLVPKIRLYQVDITRAGTQQPAREFYFSDYTSKAHVSDLLSGKADRFNEAGIQSVTWDLLGGQPAEVKRYIEVNIKLLFSSIDALTRGPSVGPKYLNLFARILKDRKGTLHRKEGYYRLRMDVGWSVPENNKIFSGERGQKLIRALEKTNKTFWLHLKNHDLNFKQDGSVELTISYNSSMEHELQRVSVIDELRKADKTDRSSNSVAAQRKILKEIKGEFNKWTACAANKKKPNFEAKRKHMAAYLQTREMRLKALNVDILLDIQNKLLENKAIKDLVIDKKAMGFTSRKTFGESWYYLGKYGPGSAGTAHDIYATNKKYDANLKSAIKGITTALDQVWFKKHTKDLQKQLKGGASKNKKTFKKATTAIMEKLKILTHAGENTLIQYAFLGDIIDATIDTCLNYNGDHGGSKNMKSFVKNSRIILGSVKIPQYNVSGKGFVSVSLSNMPISMNLFTAWFIKNVIDKGKSIYLLKDFLRHMLLELVQASTGASCFKERKNYKNFPRNIPVIGFHTLRTGADNFPFVKGAGPLAGRGRTIYKSNLKAPYSEAPAEENSKLTNYLLMYSRNIDLDTKKRKSRADDSRLGIFSINIGSPRGIVKDLTFSKADSKYLEESLLTVKPTDMSLEVFRRIYDADIKLFGNTAFFPGQHIYIDPSTVGMGHPFEGRKKNYSAARLLGLGGYYLITKVDSEISPGNFNTNIKARWVGFGDGTKGRSAAKGKKTADACGGIAFEEIEYILRSLTADYMKYVSPENNDQNVLGYGDTASRGSMTTGVKGPGVNFTAADYAKMYPSARKPKGS